MSVKVIDLNEATEEQPAIEEATEDQQQPEIINEVVEEVKEELKEEIKEEEKPKPKPKPKPKASDIVPCPDCNKNMTYKNLRYSHKCSPEPPPVKKQANPKPKAKPKTIPKPPPNIYYSESDDDDDEVPQQPLIKRKQPPQPINPTTALAQHYQLLQQAFIQQKQERYNNLCMNMFSSKSKKR